jgi:hypothetical protein
MLIAAAILLTIKNSASSSDMPLTMGYGEDKLSLVIATKILSNIIDRGSSSNITARQIICCL